jgi:FSR family fosmidomycin resistance protein-like MFS transporter
MIDGLQQRHLVHPNTLLAVLTTGHLVNDFYGHALPFLLPALIAEFDLSYTAAGFLALVSMMLSGVLQPTLGYLADKAAARKKIILTGFTAFGLGFALMGSSGSYLLVLIACLIIGLGEGTFHPQSTNLLTRTFPATKGRVMGIHGLGGSIGNFMAPLVVTFLIGAVGWRSGAHLLVIPGLLAVAVLGFFLKEPDKGTTPGFGVGLNKSLVLLGLTLASVLMLYRGFLTFLPTFLVEAGSTINEAGVISAMMLFVGLLAQPLGGILFDRWGGRFVFFGCSVGAGLALWLFTLSSGGWLVLSAMLIGVFIYALFPVGLAMGSELSKGHQIGMSVGLVFGISGTLSSLTPVITGYAGDLFGLNLSFKLLIILAVVAALLSIFLPGRPLDHSPRSMG